MSAQNTEVMVVQTPPVPQPTLVLAGVFEAAVPGAASTPLGRLARVSTALEVALPILAECTASTIALQQWSLPGLNRPVVTEGESVSRLRELRAICRVGREMIQTEAPSDSIDAFCRYVAEVVEELLREDVVRTAG